MGKILSVALKLNFTPNTWGCYGLISVENLSSLHKYRDRHHSSVVPTVLKTLNLKKRGKKNLYIKNIIKNII